MVCLMLPAKVRGLSEHFECLSVCCGGAVKREGRKALLTWSAERASSFWAQEALRRLVSATCFCKAFSRLCISLSLLSARALWKSLPWPDKQIQWKPKMAPTMAMLQSVHGKSMVKSPTPSTP